MSETGFILQPSQRRARDGRAVVQLFGRLSSGPGFLIEDTRFEPYFFAHPDVAARLADARGLERTEPSALRDLSGRRVSRLVAHAPGDVPELRRRIEAAGAPTFEADVRFAYRYLMDRGLRAGVEIAGEPERLNGGRLLRFRDVALAPAEVRVPLSVLSIDLETTLDAGRILSAALVGDACDEVHLVAPAPVEGAIVHANEKALLAALVRRMGELDPDVITGWNVVDFDVRVLVQRAAALGVRLSLGRVSGAVRLTQDNSFTRQMRAELPGRVVLDGMGLVRDARIALERYSLESAARALLGRGKLISGPDSGQQIQRLYAEDPAALVAYNREDARLVLDILEAEHLLELCIERSALCGMPLDRVGASIASFDRLYLPELRRHGRVAPCVGRERKTQPVTGGAVMDSRPGLFRSVCVYDFKSLYPSLMRTFSLDPLAHARAGDDALVAPNGARFARDGAVLPEILERFAERRDAARERGDAHADFAIKIMMNALFGVLGAASCRFFDPEVANAITRFGQQTLGWTREAFESRGKAVIYGDTDSVFVALDSGDEPERVRAHAEALLDEVQAELATRVRREYDVDSRLTLELERIYTRFWMPRLRAGTGGSKKRYAGLADGELHVVGLESVRRDWPAVGRRLQRGLLERLFSDAPLEPFVREIVERTLAGELDAELVYRKGLRKGAIDAYKSVSPHVEAARKAGSRAGRVIEYVITQRGSEPVFEHESLPADIDRAHYVDRVLRPIADAILVLVDSSLDAARGAPTQLRLF